MGYLPTKNDEMISFCSDHQEVWTTNAAALGLTTAEMTAFSDALSGAINATVEATKANAIKIAAFTDQRDQVANLRRVAGATISTIKAFAATRANPNEVYMLAQLAAPSPREAVPPPGVPTDVKVGVRLEDGAIELRWKSKNPDGGQGTSYLIRRRLGLTGPISFVGVAGGKKFFVDTTLPTGTDAVTYLINGQRSGENGPAAEVNVRFGAGGGGGFAIQSFTVTEEGKGGNGVKLAA